MTNREPRKLSIVLQETVAELKGKEASLQEISDQLGVRAFGAFIVILALPSFVPGISTLSGAFLWVFSFQMALGAQKPWMPKFISRVRVPKKTLEQGLGIILPYLTKIEHYIKPRFSFFDSKFGIQCIGFFISLFSFVVIVPVPLGNFIPAFFLLFAAFGLLQKDGLVSFLNIIIGTTYCVAYLIFVWHVFLKLVS